MHDFNVVPWCNFPSDRLPDTAVAAKAIELCCRRCWRCHYTHTAAAVAAATAAAAAAATLPASTYHTHAHV